MKREIKDYLHLYLGCEVRIEKSGYTTVHEHDYHVGEIRTLHPTIITWVNTQKIVVKPILRPLSDMTEEEAVEMFAFIYPNKTLFPDVRFDTVEKIWVCTTKIPFGHSVGIQLEHGSATQFAWLLSKGFDLFNLIPEGLALDQSLTPKQ